MEVNALLVMLLALFPPQKGTIPKSNEKDWHVFLEPKRFHLYLYGRKFELVTDHKPLLTLFNEKKTVPVQASGRIQHWALTLGNVQLPDCT